MTLTSILSSYERRVTICTNYTPCYLRVSTKAVVMMFASMINM